MHLTEPCLTAAISRRFARRNTHPFFTLATLMLLALVSGCTVQQPPIVSRTQPPAARPLPFKGRLRGGNTNALPSAVALSLSNNSPVIFLYREELTHNDYHIPMIVSAFDPATYIGAPLGDFGVSAFASLSILEGDRVLADYTARAYVTRSFSLYSQPTHRELEEAARIAVREKIDHKLYRDENQLAAEIHQAAANSPANEGLHNSSPTE
jgi:hypothetical protein